MDIFKDLFNNKRSQVILGVLILLSIFMIVLYSRQQIKYTKYSKESEAIRSTLNERLKEYELLAYDNETAKGEVSKDVTGLDPRLVGTDKEIVVGFFKDAFSWKNGKEYDLARSNYIKALGPNNSFTKTYLAEDIKIDVDGGKLAYIDYKELKSLLDSVEIIPLVAEGDRIRYVAFIRYFIYLSENDINNLDALEASEAIIQFTVSGASDDPQNRKITEVEAWSGFSTN